MSKPEISKVLDREVENHNIRACYETAIRSLCPETWEKFCEAIRELCERRNMDTAFMGKNALATAPEAPGVGEALEQPISTAPNDGTWFPAWNKYEERWVWACHHPNPDIGTCYWNGTLGISPFTLCDGDLTHWLSDDVPPAFAAQPTGEGR